MRRAYDICVRLLRVAAVLVLFAVVGLLVLWTLGPHSRPGTTDHWPQILVFVGVVAAGLQVTRRFWAHRSAA